jgi:antitoxin HigA-1
MHVVHMLPKHRPPTHPGELLRYEFLEPLGMTQKELAGRIGVSYPRVNEIINGKRGITADSALRLSQLFGTTAEFWLTGQMLWDLWHALRAPGAAEIRKIEPLRAA